MDRLEKLRVVLGRSDFRLSQRFHSAIFPPHETASAHRGWSGQVPSSSVHSQPQGIDLAECEGGSARSGAGGGGGGLVLIGG